ncbi:MAG: c-type cytochrome [Acidobacteria bacterium]|nr:c-type cytochrome [Acidobacteriota bacterium]
MRTTLLPASLLVLAIFSVAATIVAQSPKPGPARQDNLPKVARGKYLVEEVAMCSECHTPRNERGELNRSRWLQGGPLYFRPVRPNPDWALEAPNIAGLPGWNEAAAIRFFETGRDWAGKLPRPPMHQYRLPRADAEAIVAYLKTLRSGSR